MAPSSADPSVMMPLQHEATSETGENPPSLAPEDIGRKLVILGVPWETEDTTLLNHFSQYGAVEEAQIMRERYTGKSRGFGFVTYSSASEAQKAIAMEHVVDGRRCEAKFALPEGKVGSARTTRIFVARIPASVSDGQFRSYFEQFGIVQDAYMPKDPSKQGHRGIGFVTFASAESVEQVMAGTHVLGGNEVAIDRATPKERVQSGMLPGRLSMSQPNLHLVAGGSANNSMHGGAAFAFFRGAAGVAPPPSPYGGRGMPAAPAPLAGVNVAIPGFNHPSMPPPPNYMYRPFDGNTMNNNNRSIGARHMSHPVLPNSYGSPPPQQGSLAGALSTTSTTYSSSSGANLQALAAAQAQTAAQLQHHLSSNSISSLEGSTPMHRQQQQHQQQQLINLINANVAAAAAAAASPSPSPSRAGVLAQSSSTGQFPGGGSQASSSNDLAGLLPPQDHSHHSASAAHHQLVAAGWTGRLAATPSPPPTSTGGLGPPSARAGPRIFVGKLNRETSDHDVKDYFSRFGYVLDVYLPRDKTNKREHRGFGFVTFETDASIQRVVSYGPHYIRGSVIAIDSAVPRQEEMALSVAAVPHSAPVAVPGSADGSLHGAFEALSLSQNGSAAGSFGGPGSGRQQPLPLPSY